MFYCGPHVTPKQKLEGAHYIAFTARTLVTPLLWQPTSWQSVFHKHIETRCRDCTCHQSHLCTGLWRCGTIQTHPINSSHNQPLNTCGEATSQNLWSLNNRRFVWRGRKFIVLFKQKQNRLKKMSITITNLPTKGYRRKRHFWQFYPQDGG